MFHGDFNNALFSENITAINTIIVIIFIAELSDNNLVVTTKPKN